MRYWTTPVGIFIALLAYITSVFPAARTALFPRDDVRILAYRSEAQIALHNAGDRAVFVIRSVFLREDEPSWEQGRNILESIDPGQFLVIRNEHRPGRWIGSRSEERARDAIRRAIADPCSDVEVFATTDPTYLSISANYKLAGAPHLGMRIEGLLEYEVSGMSKRKQVAFDAIAVPKLLTDCEE